MRVLVTGGTGVIGRPVIDRLADQGHTVRLLSRNAERDAEMWGPQVEAHPGSVSDPSSVRGAAEGCDAVLHIAGIVAEDPPEVGPLYRHRYWADIHGSDLDAEALFSAVCREFGTLAPEPLLRVDAEGRGEIALEPGATLTLEIPLRGTIQVRVEEVEDRAATSITLSGHPLSGVIRFLVREPNGEEGRPGLRFEVRSYFRGSSVADGLVMATVGKPLQDVTWRSMVEAVVRRSGGEAADGVHSDQQTLSTEEAAHVEKWAEELVLRHRREVASL